MFSTSIRFVLSASIAVAALALTVPAHVQAAPNTGHGVVYHRSDCGHPNVRSYGGGGRWPGSACGRWLEYWTLAGIWWDGRDHNYTYHEAVQACKRHNKARNDEFMARVPPEQRVGNWPETSQYCQWGMP